VSQGVKLDRTALHLYLWSLADGVGRLRINQAHLADDLGVNRVSVARVFKELQDKGVLRKIKEGSRRVVMYEVTDPNLKETDV
jgi:CRP-like cAMP-binding protein